MVGSVPLLAGGILLCLLLLGPHARDASFDADNLYVSGCLGVTVIPLQQIRRLVPFRNSRSAYWIEFNATTRFGTRIFVVSPRFEPLFGRLNTEGMRRFECAIKCRQGKSLETP